MSTARRSAHAISPLVVDIRNLPELAVPMPRPLPAHDGPEGRDGEGYDVPELREPTFDELVHGYGRHRGSSPSRGPRRAAGRRA